MSSRSVDHNTASTRRALRMHPAIVVGVDGSAASKAAVRWAAAHSRATGLPLRVVHAWQMPAIEAAAVQAGAEAHFEAAAADARARATRWVLDTLGDDAADQYWTLDVAEGSAGPVLVARSEDAPLLVLGTGVHTGIRRVVHGSVSHYCLAHAVGPVVAVPEPATELSAPSLDELTTVGPLL